MHLVKTLFGSPFGSFWKFSLTLCLVLAISGCVSDRAAVNRDTGFSFTAEASPQGIFFNFNNIPPDAVHLSVFLEDKTANDRIYHQILIFDNEAFGIRRAWQNDLADFRKAPVLPFPFAKEGHEYEVTVTIYKDINLDDWTYYQANVVAGGGIYMTNKPSLLFTDNNRSLVLSEIPSFSGEVLFSPQRLFNYTVTVMLDENNSRGGSGSSNELSFPAHEIYNGSRDYFGFSGLLPVIAFVQANLIHENMEWIIGIARTKEVLISF